VRLRDLRGKSVVLAFYPADRAAEAAEAAAVKGKFWEIHDLLFENQDSLSDDALIGYA
jgi:protein-disulfide isomerase